MTVRISRPDQIPLPQTFDWRQNISSCCKNLSWQRGAPGHICSCCVRSQRSIYNAFNHFLVAFLVKRLISRSEKATLSTVVLIPETVFGNPPYTIWANLFQTTTALGRISENSVD